MKLKPQRSRYKGMTLIEITLVIAILMGLITVLFIGISAYKRGSDSAKCILQMAHTQKMIISYGNLNGLRPGQSATFADLITDDFVSAAPICPLDNAVYTASNQVPDSTTPFLTCVNAAAPLHFLALSGAGP